MTRQQEICSHCKRTVAAELLNQMDSGVCPYCRHALSEAPAIQPVGSTSNPTEPGREIPELTPTRSNIKIVQTASLLTFVLAIAVGIVLFLKVGGSNAGPVELMSVAVVALTSLFIWAYTQFAMNLKSGPS